MGYFFHVLQIIYVCLNCVRGTTFRSILIAGVVGVGLQVFALD